MDENEKIMCADCGEAIEGICINRADGRSICLECAGSYSRCAYCGKYYYTDSMTAVKEGGSVCDQCLQSYTVCDDCGTYYLYGHTDGNQSLCRDCYDANYYTCRSCGYIYHNDEYGQDGLCAECAEEAESRPLRQYHSNPSICFHGKKGPFYGMELETDGYGDNQENASERLYNESEENYWLSHDSSLDSGGIEIVFQPRSIGSWLSYRDTLNTLRKTILEQGGRSYDANTCGVHIHRSRDDLTDLGVARLITAFIKLRYYIEKIAQRRNDEWASFDFLERQTEEGNCKLVYKSMKEGKYDIARHVALNLTNQKTIEFRIFKGTLAVDTLYGYLLFAHLITEWCKQARIVNLITHPKERLWSEFKEYLGTEGKAGKQLLAYIQRRVG